MARSLSVAAVALACGCASALPSRHATVVIEGKPVAFDHIRSLIVASTERDVGATNSAPENCPPVPEPLPLPKPLPAEFADFLGKLRGKIQASVQASIPSVAAALTYRGDNLIEEYHGNKTLDGSNEQPTADTIYGIGSVTKIFPVLQLFMLFERGVVRSLDDPVSAYMPGFQVINPFEGEQPTLFQLATQLSGLPREAPCPGPLMGCYNATNADMVKRLSQTLLTRAPNEYPSYSNLAYALLGRTLALAADPEGKETFEMWVSKNILAPLGMDSTGFHYSDAVKARMATGYSGAAAHPMTKGGAEQIGWLAPCGSAYSTVNDLSKLAHALMRGSLFKSKALGRELLQPVFFNQGGGTLFGAPWEMWVDPSTGALVRRKGGNLAGFAALVAFVPEFELSLTMTWNSMNVDEFAASNQGFSALLPPFVELLGTLQPHAPPMPPKDFWPRYVGSYFSPALGYANLTVHQFPISGDPKRTVSVLLLTSPFVASTLVKSAPASLGPAFLQVYIPNALLPCLTNELIAFNDGYMLFSGNATDTAPFAQLEFVGNAHGITLTRVSV